jgi:ATP-binding cassette subfamily B protein
MDKDDNIVPIFTLLKKLWFHVSVKRKKHLLYLLVLIIVSSFAEIISIGAIFPFLAALTDPEKLLKIKILSQLLKIIGITSAENVLLPLSLIFGVAALTSGAIRLLLLWANNKVSYATGADFNYNIFKKTIYQPYEVHITRNSSEIISGITDKSYVLIKTIYDVLNIISSAIIFISIMLMLISVDPVVALSSIIGFGGIYGIIILLTKSKLTKNSKKIATGSTRLIQCLQEALGGIRDILIDGTQEMHCNIYRSIDLPLRRVQATNQYIYNSPKHILESLGMILITILAYYLASGPSGISKAIPVLGILALGAQRMLPVLQQAYGSLSSIYAYRASIIQVLKLLDQKMPHYYLAENNNTLTFKSDIKINDISFKYSENSSYVLKNINIKINKGSKIGFIGITGSGKTTLLDIIMGLLDVKEGTIEIDGVPLKENNCRSWQKMIAHVPQNIFLADTSIMENIAFGIPYELINTEKVKKAAEKAYISQMIEDMPDKYNTQVGERGVRLSGGQRQRIGIARALYKDADLIILDEATSALDTNTEKSVMKSIEMTGEDITLLIIAHRITTLKNCDSIIEIENGKVKRITNYDDIIKI